MDYGLGAIPIANPRDADWKDDLFCVYLGAYGNVVVYVWERGFSGVDEEVMDWAAKHAPGVFTEFSEEDYRRECESQGLSWEDFQVSGVIDDASCSVIEAVEADHVVVGHTHYPWQKGPIGIPAWEVQIREVTDPLEWFAIRMRSDWESEVSDGT